MLGQIQNGLVGSQYQMDVDKAGNLFVVNDNFLNNLQEYVAVYAPPYAAPPKKLTGVLFPIGMTVDANGTVYVANCGGFCHQAPAIYVYQHGSTTPTSTITSPLFNTLEGLAVDKNGNLYAASYNVATQASDVFKIAAGTTTPKALGLEGLDRTYGIAIDPAGNLYVAVSWSSQYILAFRPGSKTAYRNIHSFLFANSLEFMSIGPDGNLYVGVNSCAACGASAVLGFRPVGNKAFEGVGAPSDSTFGVATKPNPIL